MRKLTMKHVRTIEFTKRIVEKLIDQKIDPKYGKELEGDVGRLHDVERWVRKHIREPKMQFTDSEVPVPFPHTRRTYPHGSAYVTG